MGFTRTTFAKGDPKTPAVLLEVLPLSKEDFDTLNTEVISWKLGRERERASEIL